MNVKVACVGPCHSGKTTLMRRIKTAWPHHVHLVHENIRDRISNIDDVRSNSVTYFKLQQEVIARKIAEEDETNKLDKKLIFIDRSLADSLFYLTFYTDIRKFTPEQKREFSTLVNLVHAACSVKRYDIIYMFSPLDISENDAMRPADLAVTQAIEHRMIETLNVGLFTGHSRIVKINAKDGSEQVMSTCKDIVQELES